ncbi:DUF2381 family protein [Hyalangium versicolor]|uniref:DUF2381 family protein n=1 Tax=Hyalangium versicolor TaxID=2861190 RepID=UPI001CCCF246|nr:DUF2381 family protein [Hyalangium versicolor]
MFLPSPLHAVALASLLGCIAATAQAAPDGRSGPRSIVLTGKAGESPLIYLAPGSFTFIVLDAPIVRESVQVEGRARFARVDPSDLGITLVLAAPIAPTERLALRFTYREGSPESVVFLLTGQPGEVDTVVSVSRPQQTVEACRVELAVTRERCEAQSGELEELKARPPAVSPAAVALAGLVDADGMMVLVWQECRRAKGEFRIDQCRVLAASTWTVVVFEVSNPGAEPWTPAWAEVTPAAGGVARRARAVLSGQVAIPPGGTVSVAIEVEMPGREPEAWLQALHSLRVCNADGSRCLSVPQVTL